MWLVLLVASIGAGVIATTVMLPLFYLPRLWGRPGYDVIGALGSALTHALNARARLVGALVFYLGGVVFAFIYGLVAYGLLVLTGLEEVGPRGENVWAGSLDAALAFPLLGLGVGMAHGGVVALLLTIMVVEHHPLGRYRKGMELLFPVLVAHPVFGIVVMLMHRMLLQRWL